MCNIPSCHPSPITFKIIGTLQFLSLIFSLFFLNIFDLFLDHETTMRNSESFQLMYYDICLWNFEEILILFKYSADKIFGNRMKLFC